MAQELLKALANPTNQAILSLLAIEPTYPRRVSELLSLGESDVSRRLTGMEKVGLVESEWEHVSGKNVKTYRLVPERVHVRFGGRGVSVELESADDADTETTVIDRLRMRIPEPEGFVGREHELELLDGPEPVVVVEGIAGIGKTILLAAYAHDQRGDRPVFFHSFKGTESLTWLAHRVGVFAARQGDRSLLEAIEKGAPLADRRELVLEAFDRADQVVVLDAVERIRDEDLDSLITDAIDRVREGKLVLAGRQRPRIEPGAAHARQIRLSGLGEEDVGAFFKERGVAVDPEVLGRVHRRLGGHPLALNLLAEAATEMEAPVAEVLEGLPDKEIEAYLLEEVHDHLSQPERQVLAHASVFRGRFTRKDLEAIYPKNPGGALVKLHRRRLIRDDGDEYALHSLLRSFFYDRLENPSTLHEEAAEHMLTKGTLEARLDAMDHLLSAGERRRVLALLERDLDLEEFDLIEEGYHNLYRDVLERFDPETITDPNQAALVHDERGDLRYHEGDHEAAIEHYRQAQALFADADGAERLADLAWKTALALNDLGREDEAREHVRDGLEEHDPDERTRARLQKLADELGLDT